MLVVEGIDAAGMALAAHIIDCAHHIERILEFAVIFEECKQRGELFGGEEVLLADFVFAVNHDELIFAADGEACGLGQLLCGDGNGVRQTVTVFIPHNLLERLGFLLVCKVAAFGFERFHHCIVNGSVNHQVAVAGAAGAKVGILADAGVHGRFLYVRGLVDNHRGVARAGAVSRGAGAVSGFDHRPAACGDDKVRTRHQLFGDGDAGLFDALENVRRGAFPHERFAHDVNGFFRDALGTRMGRENHNVTGLNGINGLADRGDDRIRRGDKGSDDAHGLCILGNAFFRDFFDHAHTLCTQCIAQDTLGLVALADFADRVAQASLFNCLIGKRLPGLQVDNGPGHSLNQLIDALLIVCFNDLRGGLRAGEQIVQHFDFFQRDFSFCHGNDAPFRMLSGAFVCFLFRGA